METTETIAQSADDGQAAAAKISFLETRVRRLQEDVRDLNRLLFQALLAGNLVLGGMAVVVTMWALK